MERTTAPSLAAIRSNALATALALALGVSAGVAAAAALSPQQSLGFGSVGGDAGAQMRHWLANHPDIAQAQMKNVTGGATLQVTNCNDSGAGSLRAAVAAAPEDGSIDMSGLSCVLITLDGSLFVEQDTLYLNGNGITVITTTPSTVNGLINHNGIGILYLNNVNLTGGVYEATTASSATGGCVWSLGQVWVTGTIIDDCIAVNHDNDAAGGAIYAGGGVRMHSSVITGSGAIGGPNGVGRGGGIYAAPGGLTMKYSTLEGNRASGGLFGEAGGAWTEATTTIWRSTISNNIADNAGGLVVNSAMPSGISIRNSTLSYNGSDGSALLDTKAPILLRTAGDITLASNTVAGNVNLENFGGGLFLAAGAALLQFDSNIVSGNLAGDGGLLDSSDIYLENGGTITGSHNLVGQFDSNTVYNFPVDTIRQLALPSYLGLLQDNGGPTETMALSTGSWAFNLGDAYPPSSTEEYPDTDQRTLPREVGAGVDIGAFESDALFIGRFEDPPTSL